MDYTREQLEYLASLPKDELRKVYDAGTRNENIYSWIWFARLRDYGYIDQQTFEYVTRANENIK